MNDAGRILIADDEDTFLRSTAVLLEDEGFSCATVPDADRAKDLLRKEHYDLLIADIKMPGNAELELIRSLDEIAPGMPVILVTGYPTLTTAIQSIRLPVMAYMVKPVDFDQLMAAVKSAIEYARVQRAVRSTKQRLSDWEDRLSEIQIGAKGPMAVGMPGSMDSFLALTHDNVLNSLSDLLNVTRALSSQSKSQMVCHLTNCPRLLQYVEAIEDTVKVLERTKSAFKSKDLGDLRKRLEDLLAAERHAAVD